MKLSYSNFKYSNNYKGTLPLEILLDIVNHVNIISYCGVKRTIIVSLIQSGSNFNISTVHLKAEIEKTESLHTLKRLLLSMIYPN